jgi:hypothetical protein
MQAEQLCRLRSAELSINALDITCLLKHAAHRYKATSLWLILLTKQYTLNTCVTATVVVSLLPLFSDRSVMANSCRPATSTATMTAQGEEHMLPSVATVVTSTESVYHMG